MTMICPSGIWPNSAKPKKTLRSEWNISKLSDPKNTFNLINNAGEFIFRGVAHDFVP